MTTVNPINALSLPDSIGELTINQFMDHPDTEIVKKGNRLSIRRKTDLWTAVLEFISYDSGYKSIQMSSAPRKEFKRDYESDIRQMKCDGMSQKDIAFNLGISESYISQILKAVAK